MSKSFENAPFSPHAMVSYINLGALAINGLDSNIAVNRGLLLETVMQKESPISPIHDALFLLPSTAMNSLAPPFSPISSPLSAVDELVSSPVIDESIASQKRRLVIDESDAEKDIADLVEDDLDCILLLYLVKKQDDEETSSGGLKISKKKPVAVPVGKKRKKQSKSRATKEKKLKDFDN